MREKWLPDFRQMAKSVKFERVDDYCGIHAEIYDNFRADIKPELAFYRSLLNLSKARVAELGCGTGFLSLPLAGYCEYYLALDANEDMLNILRNKLAKKDNHLPIDVRHGDFLDFSMKSEGSFDLVCIPYNTLVHLTSRSRQIRLFRRIGRALRPGGILVVDVWMPSFQVGEITHRISMIDLNSESWIVYSQELFPDSHMRIVNILLLPVNGSHRPKITSFSEYVFARSDILQLYRNAGMIVSRLSGDHPMVKNEKRRLVYIGRRP